MRQQQHQQQQQQQQQLQQQVAVGGRPASRARARSPGGPASVSTATRQSQNAAYGFQSPQATRSSASGPGGTSSSTAAPPREYASLPNTGAGPVAGVSRSCPEPPWRESARPSGARAYGSVAVSSADPKPAQRSTRLAVVVRKRPMNRREEQAQQQDVVKCQNSGVFVREPKLKVDLTRYVEEHNFQFDQSFDETVSNEQLYGTCVRPIIDAVFQRAKCTCFAYGQTGSGKTFTMMGPPRRPGEVPAERDRTPGIFLLASQDIFRTLANKEHSHLGVYIAFYEIYCGKLFDLLNNRQILQARENAKSNVVIVGLQEHPVDNVMELMEVIEFGLNSRTTGVTGANTDSSRSHAILQISLKDTRNKEDGKLKEHGKISFIDLAGSERGADHTLDTDRQTRMDGAEINKSLLALKECIRSLDQQLDHTPFRGSKLTQVLKDSFIGSNCRTVMIANVSPCGCAVEHSLNTLRYAYRVKELRRCSGSGQGAMLGAVEFGSGDGAVQAVQSLASPRDAMANQLETHAHAATAHLGAVSSLPSAVTELTAQATQQQHVDELIALAPAHSAPSGGYAGVGAGPTHARNRDLGLVPGPQEASCVGAPFGEAEEQQNEVGGLGLAMSGGQLLPQARPELAPEVDIEPVGRSQAALDELARQHDRLIGTILAEEEELITSHRQHIDMMVELIKEEMVHLNNVDRPGSDVDAYVGGLDRILTLKAQYIGDIRHRVDLFKEHLQQETALSRNFQALASSDA